MTKIYFGCDEIPRNWNRYFALCNAVEIDLEKLENPPKSETLNSWRVQSPKGFAFMLHAQSSLVTSLDGAAEADAEELPDGVHAAWASTMEQANALAARAIILRTPLSFSPGIATRRLIEKFAKELAQPFGRPVIWEAQGPWDIIGTRQWAADLGLTFAYDPFLALREEIGLLHGDGAFIVNERAGLRREFDRYDISVVLDAMKSYNRAFFLLRGRFKWSHAGFFRDLLKE